MAASWLQKVFVPEKDNPANVGHPEPASSFASKEQSASEPGDQNAPGNAGNPGPDQGQGQASAENAQADAASSDMDNDGSPKPASSSYSSTGDASSAMPHTGAPPVNMPEYQYHYPSFEENGESRFWNQHTRIILAILFMAISAGVIWWILI